MSTLNSCCKGLVYNNTTANIACNGTKSWSSNFNIHSKRCNIPSCFYISINTASESLTQTITVKSFVDPDNALCAFGWDNASDLDIYIVADGDALSDSNALNGYNMATGSNPEKGSLLATSAPDGVYHVVANVWTGVGTSANFTLSITDAAGSFLSKSGDISWTADKDYVVAATIKKTGSVITFVE